MYARTTVLHTLLKAGDHIIAGDCLYGGSHDFLTRYARTLGWTYSFVDTQRPETWQAALTPRTRVFLAETITNPLMRVGRMVDVVAFCREHGLTSIIDNTFASPVNFRPLRAGFDVCFH